ncbi:fimbrial protein [Pseudomonas sp. BRG-100]|uniref:fimbrial protein n=1 Tax=Pseudomonas sp. BRG-100 TaxID=1524267 RepID=UPI0013DFFD73|nr:fimbrial protein [Pseudomonas sp. BRG-100]
MHADNTLTLCTGNDSWGVLNDRGSSPTTSALFPIGNTGLSWQYIYRGVAEKGYGYLTTAGNTTTSSMANTTAALRIVKTGDVVSGASIPAGDLGGLKYGGLRLSTIRLTDSLTITSPACQTPNVNVVMGQQRLGDIPTDGSPTKENIPFSVKLNNCPAGISKVMYTLTPTSSSPSLNSSQGIIALNQTSTAQGIGLQITDSDLTPIPLNEPKLFNDYSATGGSFVIPLNARYSRIASGSKVSPGTANAEITFVMSYL